jgi:hypothetical protein
MNIMDTYELDESLPFGNEKQNTEHDIQQVENKSNQSGANIDPKQINEFMNKIKHMTIPERLNLLNSMTNTLSGKPTETPTQGNSREQLLARLRDKQKQKGLLRQTKANLTNMMEKARENATDTLAENLLNNKDIKLTKSQKKKLQVKENKNKNNNKPSIGANSV